MERLPAKVAHTVNDEKPQLRDIDILDLPLSRAVQGVDQWVTGALDGFEPRPIIRGPLEAKVPMKETASAVPGWCGGCGSAPIGTSSVGALRCCARKQAKPSRSHPD